MGAKGKSRHAGTATGSAEQSLRRLLSDTAKAHRRDVVFADFVEAAALAISNAVDAREREAREARYLQIAARYDKEDFAQFPTMLAHLTMVMEEGVATSEFDDVLGRLYMTLDMGDASAGQFFTPFHVSQLMAGLTIGDAQHVLEQGFIRLHEPTCGAGGMVIAMAQALANAGLNYQQTLHATCIDIDSRCVHMAYLQLALLHIPAIVIHGNSLSMQTWSTWRTPAHVLGGWEARVRAREDSRAEPSTQESETATVEHAHKQDEVLESARSKPVVTRNTAWRLQLR